MSDDKFEVVDQIIMDILEKMIEIMGDEGVVEEIEVPVFWYSLELRAIFPIYFPKILTLH